MRCTLLLLVLVAGCGPSADAGVVGDCRGTPVSLGLSLDSGGEDTGWSWDDAAVTSDVDGTTVILHLLGFPGNCCPSPGAEVAVDGTDVRVDVDDVTSGTPCRCSCIQDFDVEITGLDAGSWHLEVWYWEELRAELDVTVA